MQRVRDSDPSHTVARLMQSIQKAEKSVDVMAGPPGTVAVFGLLALTMDRCYRSGAPQNSIRWRRCDVNENPKPKSEGRMKLNSDSETEVSASQRSDSDFGLRASFRISAFGFRN